MRWLKWSLVAVVATGCGITGLGIREGAEPPAKPTQQGSISSVEAYQLTTYALVKQKNCASCHNTGTTNPFASSDINIAHTEALQNVNFANPNSSMFVVQVMNGHCGADCNTDGTQMRATIEEWKKLAGK